MRRIIDFTCEDSALAGTLDEGQAKSGLFIVSGGNEIRIGAHRGMAELAQIIASIGHPVFRFDRRGVGDSEGENNGFESSAPDLAAALTAFRINCPQMSRVVAFGNCDAATTLILHETEVDHLVLANPWVIESTDDLPPPAVIKDRYARRFRDPNAWIALFTGKINIRSAIRGLGRISKPKTKAKGLADRVAAALAQDSRTTTILLATGDNTAVAFADAWKGVSFARARLRENMAITTMNSKSHSFASEADFAILVETLTNALEH